MCTLILAGCPAPLMTTPSFPSLPRDNGMMASGPASPASPSPPDDIGKYVGVPITPPEANGLMAPSRLPIGPLPAPPNSPPNNCVSPPLTAPVMPPAIGLNAADTARLEIRNASDCNTCLLYTSDAADDLLC